jgi:hypothetical protein
MVKTDEYYLHQTPQPLAKKLIETLDLVAGDTVLEPFKGEGSFYNELPDFVVKDWTEIEEGRDYLSNTNKYDWIISNPPFKLETAEPDGAPSKRVNAFWKLVLHYTNQAQKGIAFLGNDYCLSTFTPTRMKVLNQAGWYLHGVQICAVKKWRGRYFFLTFKKIENKSIGWIDGTF